MVGGERSDFAVEKFHLQPIFRHTAAAEKDCPLNDLTHISAMLTTSSRMIISIDGMAGNRASLVRKCVAPACIAAAIWMASGVRILWRDLSCAAASAISTETSEVITFEWSKISRYSAARVSLLFRNG